MKCPKCGTEMKDDHLYCEHCGEEIYIVPDFEPEIELNLEQTQELRLPEGMPGAAQILGTWGQVILRGKEWRGDQAACNGGVMAFVLYAPEDGSGPRVLESWIPFQMKWELPDNAPEGTMRRFGKIMLRYFVMSWTSQ